MNEPRTVTGDDSVAWSCVQAVSTTDDVVTVVCTPSGGERSVRIELPPSWLDDVPDAELLEAIERARSV